MRSLVERLRSQTLGDVRSRLAASLLGQATHAGGTVADVRSSQSEWAEDLGTVREALARELKAFKDAGLIEQLGRGRYRILQAEELESLAGSGSPTENR